MKAFGPQHAHPDLETCETPVGEKCLWCEETVAESDQGFVVGYSGDPEGKGWAAYHRNCFLRTIFGSVGHQRKTCSCYGGTEEDPDGMTKRQAADVAVNTYLIVHPQSVDHRSLGIPEKS